MFRDVGASRPCLSVCTPSARHRASIVRYGLSLVSTIVLRCYVLPLMCCTPHGTVPCSLTKRTSVNLFITNRTIVTIVKQREAQAYLGVHSQLKMGTVTHPDPPAPAGAAFAGASNAPVPSQYRAGRARRVEVHQLSLLRVTVPVSWAVAASAAWTMTSRDASFGAQRPEHEHLSLFGATHCCLALDHCEP